MKNIALVVSDFDNTEVKKGLAALYPKLSEKYNVKIIAYKGNSSEEYGDNLITLDIPFEEKGLLNNIISKLKRIFQLRKLAKNENIRLIISLCEKANHSVAYSFTSVKKSIYCGSFSDCKKNGAKYAKMLKHSDAILIRSKALGTFFEEQYPSVSGRIKVIEHPIDLENIETLSKEPIADEYKALYESKKIIAVSAPFTYEKGHWNILKAFAILKESVKDAALVFIGAGGEYEEKIRKMASDSINKDDIIFINETKNPYKYIANAAVYAQSDISDGGQLSLLEAIACNTPVVASDCMTAEILFSKFDPEFKCKKMTFADYGIITPSFDTREDYNYIASYSEHIDLANAIKEMILSEKIPEILRKKAYKSLERYSSEKILKSYIEFADKLYLCL